MDVLLVTPRCIFCHKLWIPLLPDSLAQGDCRVGVCLLNLLAIAL